MLAVDESRDNLSVLLFLRLNTAGATRTPPFLLPHLTREPPSALLLAYLIQLSTSRTHTINRRNCRRFSLRCARSSLYKEGAVVDNPGNGRGASVQKS